MPADDLNIQILGVHRSESLTRLLNYFSEHNVPADLFTFHRKAPAEVLLSRPRFAAQQVSYLFKLLPSFPRFRQNQILCFTGHYAAMLLVRVFGPFLPQKFHLYIYNFYLHELGKNAVVRRILRLLLNTKKTTVIVQSPEEVEYYSALSRNPPIFVPYCEDDRTIATKVDLVPQERYIFTGGYSNRDYGSVLKCAEMVPHVRFVIVASRANKEFDTEPIPPNVTIHIDIEPSQFYGLLKNSACVIIPLKENVGASGQMVAVASMRLEKPVIYTDISAINYYFAIDSAGIPYTVSDSKSLRQAVEGFLSLSSEQAQAMGRRARANYLTQFTSEQANRRLLDIMVEGRSRWGLKQR